MTPPSWKSPPCETVLDILEDRGWTTAKFAHAMGLQFHEIESFLDNEIKIDADFAQKLENVFGVPADFWLRRQYLYDNPRSEP